MDKTVMFSSKNGDWETPCDLFARLNRIFTFELDVCASEENHKCARYYTKTDDGLTKEWADRNWMNPPYGRQISKWVEKADRDAQIRGSLTVALLPARVDTTWFSEFCARWHFVFLRGRIRFVGATSGTPFPSMLVFFGIPAVSFRADSLADACNVVNDRTEGGEQMSKDKIKRSCENCEHLHKGKDNGKNHWYCWGHGFPAEIVSEPCDFSCDSWKLMEEKE